MSDGAGAARRLRAGKLAGANFTNVDVYGVNLKGVSSMDTVRGWQTTRNTDKAVF